MRKKAKGSKTARALTMPEVQRMLDCLKDHQRDRALLDVAVHIGLRASDLLRLEWPWVLNAEQSGINGDVMLVEQKTGRTVELPLTNPLRVALNRWWVESGRPISGIIFPSRKGGGPMTSDNLTLLIKKWARQIGINPKGLSSHSLRKAFGRAWRKAGKPIEHLMERFGHSSPAITKRYLGLVKDEIDRDAEAVNFHPQLRQNVLVTNRAAKTSPPNPIPSPAPNRCVAAEEMSETTTPERPSAHILANWRKLPLRERAYVVQIMVAEMNTQLMDSHRE